MEICLIDKGQLSYSIGGMAQYYDSIVECIEHRLTSKIKSVIINTSLQPNSIPHFGTITTLFSSFCLAKMINNVYNLNAVVEVDFLECSPSAHFHKVGGEQCYPISRVPFSSDSELSIADYFMNNYYLPLLNWIKNISGVNYSTRLYKDFQKNETVRSTIISICNDRNYFETLLSPKLKTLHIRPECPSCGGIDKRLKKTRIKECTPDHICLTSSCIKHGAYVVDITTTNKTYVEINTQLRDIAKGALMHEYYENNILGVMLDGGDWGGAWTHSIQCLSLQRLNCQIPVRLFAPLILDWSGGKLSKSIYSQSVNTFNNPLENYQIFMEHFGEKGLVCIYNEVEDWLSEPKKFFRNYSLEYILQLLDQNY